MLSSLKRTFSILSYVAVLIFAVTLASNNLSAADKKKNHECTIPNNSFESPLSNFYSTSLKGAKIARTTDNPKSGKYALRIFIKENASWDKTIWRGNAVLSKLLPVVGGETMRIKFFVRHKNASKVIPLVSFFDAKGPLPKKAITLFTPVEDTTDWYSFMRDFKVPENAIRMQVTIYGWAYNRQDAILDIDDIRIASPGVFEIALTKPMQITYEHPVVMPTPKKEQWLSKPFNSKNVKNIIYFPSKGGYEKATAQKVKEYIFPKAELKLGKQNEILKNAVVIGNLNSELFKTGIATMAVLKNDFKQLAGKSQGYILKLTTNSLILLAGNDGAGSYYAFRTLLQIKNNNSKLQQAKIIDWPDMLKRGFSFQMTRRPFFNKEFSKKFIFELTGGLKYNRLILAVQWGDAMQFAYPENRIFNRSLRAMTKQELQWLINYGKENFITIYPMINTPSHGWWMTERIPELKLMKKSGNLSPAEARKMGEVMDTANPLFFKKLLPVLKETYEAFGKPEYFHIGQDEIWVYDYKHNSSIKVSKYAEKYTRAQLIYNELKKQSDYLHQLGVKHVVMWADMLIPNFNGGEKLGNVSSITPKVAQLGIMPMHWTAEGMEVTGQENYLTKHFKKYIWSCNSLNSKKVFPKKTPQLDAVFSNLWAEIPWLSIGVGKDGKMTSRPRWQYGKLIYDSNAFWNLASLKHKSYNDFATKYSNALLKITAKRNIAGKQFIALPLKVKLYDFNNIWQVTGYGFDFSLIKNIHPEQFGLKLTKNSALLLTNSNNSCKLDINRKTADIALLYSANIKNQAEFVKKFNKDRWGIPKVYGLEVAKYVITYQDGETATGQIRMGYDINSWSDQSKMLYNASLIYNIPYRANSVSAYLYIIKNPQPDKKVAKVDFIKTDNNVEIALFGISSSK